MEKYKEIFMACNTREELKGQTHVALFENKDDPDAMYKIMVILGEVMSEKGWFKEE